MKKFLPKSKVDKSQTGFTLIELLVVVAIIAILTVIAISIYAGVQAKARDGRRQTEIDSLAKSIEVRKNATTATYSYDDTMYDADYPNTKPQDPLGSATRPYCIINSKPGDPTPWTGATCPAGWQVIPSATSCIMGGAGCTFTTAPSSWKICASLEGSSAVFCKSSF